MNTRFDSQDYSLVDRGGRIEIADGVIVEIQSDNV